MDDAGFPFIRSIFRPWHIRIGGAAITVFGVYDVACNQFGLPSVRRLVGMSGSLLPWWGWLLLLQGVLVLGLFEYVRRVQISAGLEVQNQPLGVYRPSFAGGAPDISTLELAQELRMKMATFNDDLHKLVAGLNTDLSNEIILLREYVDTQQKEKTQYVLKRIVQVEESQIDASAIAKVYHLDLMCLLDWAVNRASHLIIEGFLATRPTFDRLGAPSNEDERNAAIESIDRWSGSVLSYCDTLSMGGSIRLLMEDVRTNGEFALRNLAPEQRPIDLDAYAFQDYFLAVYRCDRLGNALNNAKLELELDERAALHHLRVQLNLHQQQHVPGH